MGRWHKHVGDLPRLAGRQKTAGKAGFLLVALLDGVSKFSSFLWSPEQQLPHAVTPIRGPDGNDAVHQQCLLYGRQVLFRHPHGPSQATSADSRARTLAISIVRTLELPCRRSRALLQPARFSSPPSTRQYLGYRPRQVAGESRFAGCALPRKAPSDKTFSVSACRYVSDAIDLYFREDRGKSCGIGITFLTLLMATEAHLHAVSWHSSRQLTKHWSDRNTTFSSRAERPSYCARLHLEWTRLPVPSEPPRNMYQSFDQTTAGNKRKA